jgi:hypothetical protein
LRDVAEASIHRLDRGVPWMDRARRGTKVDGIARLVGSVDGSAA